MYIFNFITLFSVTSLLSLVLASPFEPSLQHRQQGSCATTPCPKGLCCSKFNYCGTGADYCQAGSCSGGVGGTCAAGLCCSKFGYCGSGPEFCPPVVTTTSKVITTTTTSKKPTTTATTTTKSSTTTSASPTPSSTNCGTTGGPCAPGFCCSVWGWCGQGPLYCGS